MCEGWVGCWMQRCFLRVLGFNIIYKCWKRGEGGKKTIKTNLLSSSTRDVPEIVKYPLSYRVGSEAVLGDFKTRYGRSVDRCRGVRVEKIDRWRVDRKKRRRKKEKKELLDMVVLWGTARLNATVLFAIALPPQKRDKLDTNRTHCNMFSNSGTMYKSFGLRRE